MQTSSLSVLMKANTLTLFQFHLISATIQQKHERPTLLKHNIPPFKEDTLREMSQLEGL